MMVPLAGRRVTGRQTRNLTANLDVGTKAPLEFYRDGTPRTVTAPIAKLPTGPSSQPWASGVKETPLPDGKGAGLEVDQVRAGSPVQAGLRPGMKILGMARRPVRSLAEFDPRQRFQLRARSALFVLTPDGQTRGIWVGGPMPKLTGPRKGKGNRGNANGQGRDLAAPDQNTSPRRPEC